MNDGQERVEVSVFQGEEPDARRNLKIGRFMVEGLDRKAMEGSPILFDMRLNLNGILEVEVIERHTGLKKRVTIEDAFRRLSAEELAQAREKLEESLAAETGPEFWDKVRSALGGDEAEGDLEVDEDSDLEADADDDAADDDADDDADQGEAQGTKLTPPPSDTLDESERQLWSKAAALLEKAWRKAEALNDVDRAEVRELADNLHEALEGRRFAEVERFSDALSDVLFYLE